VKSGLWRALAVMLAVCGNAQLADAALILPDRGTLDRLLRTEAVRENFERFPVDPFGAIDLDVDSLDATTVTNGQGPGLLVPGITIEDESGLQWNGRGYFGQPSRTISGGSTLHIDFHDPVGAFGLDLLVFAHLADIARVSVFAADDTTLIGTFQIPVFDPSFEMFFGIADRGRIGRVSLTGTTWPWSPVVDDLTFGTRAVPEPGVAILFMVGGAMAWRRFRRR